MIKIFLIISLLNIIFGFIYINKRHFSESELPYIYMQSNNRILEYSTFNNTNRFLHHIFPKNDSILYSEFTSSRLLSYTKLINESEIQNGYYKSSTTSNGLNVSYFNDSYYFEFSLKKEKSNYFISLESIGPINLIYFENKPGYNNSISFVDFNFNFSSEVITMNTKKSFTLKESTTRTNCYCTLSSTNNTVCGLIKIFKKGLKCYWNYTLVLLNDDTTYSEIIIYSGGGSSYYNTYENELGEIKKFIKLIPLEGGKILYCIEESGILCSLIQVKNKNIATLIKNKKIFGYYSDTNKNSFSGIKYKDNQVILCLLMKNIYVTLSKITIFNNNSFI